MNMSILAVFIYTLIPSMVLAASQASAAGKSSTYVSNSIVIKKDGLACGGHEVFIASTCVKVDVDTARCRSQEIIFNKDNVMLRSFALKYDDESMIVGVVCENIGNEYLVHLVSSNFSSCDVCEWDDFFRSNGEYIGSTREKFGAVNFHYKDIPVELQEKIKSAVKQPGAIQIDRKF
jgi:hypothetical protein